MKAWEFANLFTQATYKNEPADDFEREIMLQEIFKAKKFFSDCVNSVVIRTEAA